MLRKKLILRLGLVVVALVVAGAVGVWFFRGAFRELGQIDAQRPRITEATRDLETSIANLASVLLASNSSESTNGAVMQVGSTLAKLDEVIVPEGVDDQRRVTIGKLRLLATQLDTNIAMHLEQAPADADAARDQSLLTLLQMRREASFLPILASELAAAQRLGVIDKVHAIAVWLGITVIVLTVVAGVVLYSAARLVLKPMSALLKVSRELSRDRFDARVPAGQPVEFAELASGYNLLAAKMQQNEKRTLETLQQLALTLNHELNNAFAIVEMQLERLKRQSPDDPTLSVRLKEIRETLSRMTVTVKSLTNLKRVVLTEYLPGQKMLDLAKSVADDDANGGKEWTKAEVKITPGTSQTSTRSC